MWIKELKKQKNGKVSVRIDGAEGFVLYASEAAAFGLREESELPREVYQEICESILKRRARARLLHLLAARDYPSAVLEQKLKKDGHPDAVIEDAVRYVKDSGFVDDERYAGEYVRMHQRTKTRRQIAYALSQKGIRRDTVQKALAYGYEADETQMIRAFLEKKKYDPETASASERRRISQALLRRGFSPFEISRQVAGGVFDS